MITVQYEAWTITAYPQASWGHYQPFVAIARREVGNCLCGVNAEGRSLDEAIANVKLAIAEHRHVFKNRKRS